MTLRYDDLPIAESSRHGSNTQVDAWQQTHPPLVTVRVWLGADGAVMSSVMWLDSIGTEEEAMLKPLEEMLLASLGLQETTGRLVAGLVLALQYRDAIVPIGEGN